MMERAPVPPVGREPAHCSAGAAVRTRRERRGSWARPGAPRRTAKTAPAPRRTRPPPPPGNGWLRSLFSSDETDETDFGTVCFVVRGQHVQIEDRYGTRRSAGSSEVSLREGFLRRFERAKAAVPIVEIGFRPARPADSGGHERGEEGRRVGPGEGYETGKV